MEKWPVANVGANVSGCAFVHPKHIHQTLPRDLRIANELAGFNFALPVDNPVEFVPTKRPTR